MRHAASSKTRYRRFRQEGPKFPGRPGGRDARVPVGGPAERRKYLRMYASWLKPFRFRLAAVFSLALIAVALTSVKPILMQMVIDRGILITGIAIDEQYRRITLFGTIMLVAVVLGSGIDALRNRNSYLLNAHIIQSVRRRLFGHMLKLSLNDLAEMKSGGVASRLSGDVDHASGLVQSALLGPALAIIQGVTALTIVYVWNWRLALAISLVVPPVALLHMVWIRRIRPIHRSMRHDRTEIDAHVAEIIGGIRVVRAFRREDREQVDYVKGHHTVLRKGFLAHMLSLVFGSAWTLLMPSISVVIIWYGGFLVVRDQAAGVPNPTTVGQLFAFQGYVFLLLQPVMSLVSAWSQTQHQLAAMERIFDVMTKPQDKPDAPDALPAPPVVREVCLRNVSFAYNPDTPVLHDINLTVPGGSMVALVGRSGAGKSTLTDVIARFHDPTTGAVLLNGIDLRQIKLHDYRSLLAIVQQETFLFDGTLRDNIAYSRRDATDEQIVDAARRAHAQEFIEQMPDGYDTIIGERGFKLSGGQRQRLAIARAILANPQILILDEATSSLDTESEQHIQAALEELFANRTTFVIAHRLSTITHADMIVVLDAGVIVEQGTHEQLMAVGGVYARMIQRQRASLEAMEASLE